MKNFLKRLLGIPYKVNGVYTNLEKIEKDVISLSDYIKEAQHELQEAKYSIIIDCSHICTCHDFKFTKLDNIKHKDGLALALTDNLYKFLEKIPHVISYDKRIINKINYGPYEKISDINDPELLWDYMYKDRYYIIFENEKDFASFKIKFMK